MSTDKRVTFNEYGEPVVVITIKGWDDAFRFAWALAHLQCEFVDLGRRIAGSLRRRLGAERFRQFHARFTSGSLHWGRDDPDGQPPTLAELQALVPHAALETSCGGEVTIWTGWAVNHRDPDGPLIDWCEDCESTGLLGPGETCATCGRAGTPQSSPCQ